MFKLLLLLFICFVALCSSTYITPQMKYSCPEGYRQYFALCVPDKMWDELMQ